MQLLHVVPAVQTLSRGSGGPSLPHASCGSQGRRLWSGRAADPGRTVNAGYLNASRSGWASPGAQPRRPLER